MPILTRVWLLGLAAILALVAGYGAWRIQREYPPHWARILVHVEMPESLEIDLQKALREISDADGPKANTRLPLAEFVQSNGNRIQVILVQGQFFDASIEPREVWRTLGRDVLLVSSVDERRSGTGGLSGPITAGCGVPPEKEVTQELGTTSINTCQGVYGESFHIKRIARLSAIVEASDFGQSPCWERYGITAPENDYQTCVGNAVAGGLSELFSQVDSRPSIDAVILPAIGTGVGKLSKAGFYNKLLVDTLVPQLNRDHYIPPALYLQVLRGDPDKRWPETLKSIAGAVATAVTTWDFKSEHKNPDSEWLSLTGVAIGGCLMLLALSFGVHSEALSDFFPVVTPFRPLLFISWIAAAIGLVSVFKVFVSFFPAHFSPYLQVAIGVLTALLCGPLVRSGRTVEDILKNNKSDRLPDGISDFREEA